jgi:hypothetical protein
MVGVTDGIMMDGVMADTGLPVVTVDGVMKDMMAANTLSPIQDMAKVTIAADPRGHRISRTIV